MHSIKTQTIIGTQKSVYRDSPAGKLERNRVVETMFLVPHHQGFDSDSQACFSVGVHNLTATNAFKKCVVGTMPTLSHSTAVATPFRGMVGIANCETDVLVETPTFEGCFEQKDRHPQNFFVESPTFRLESCELFNPNISIVFESQVDDVSHDFTNTILNEVSFFGFKFSETLPCSVTSLVCETLKFLPSFKYLLSLNPNIFTKVSLFEDFTFRSQHTDSEALAIDINSDHIPSSSDFSFFGEESNNLSIRGQSISFTYPTITNQRGVSLIVSVLLYRNSNSLPWIQPELNEESAFSEESLTVSRNVEFNSDVIQSIALTPHNIPLNITNNLTIEGGGFLAS